MKLLTSFVILAPLFALGAELPAQVTEAPRVSQVSTQDFRFNGGSFDEFVTKLGAVYGSNVLELLEVPDERLMFRIPKMKVPRDYLELRGPLYAYNSISKEGDWYLGKWIFYPESPAARSGGAIFALVFLPPKLANPDGGGGVTVRAFYIPGNSETTRKHLHELVEIESSRLEITLAEKNQGRGDPSQARGTLRFHEGSGLLVATGGKAYLDLVASVVEAFEKRRVAARPL